jgi:hypothetical protein
MRSFFTFLLALLAGISGAQNWAPVNRNEKFNFSLTGQNYISNTIWVDSAFASGSDSIFFLNRIVTDCDTCTAGYKLCNQGGFLKKKMIKRAGGIYEFRLPGSLVFQTLAAVGHQWLYDTANSVTATMNSKSFSVVFGISDSIERINLSNGGVIYLSKNHGVLQFTGMPVGNVYDLMGIEGRNLGALVPKFAQIYNFQVGDVFQYFHHDMNNGVGYGHENLTKITVLSRDSLPGSYSYYVRKISCGWETDLIGHHGDTTHTYELTSMNYQDSLTHPANYYPQQIIENPTIPVGWPGGNTGYTQVVTDTLGIYCKYFGTFNNGDDPPLYQHGNLLTPPLSYELLSPVYFVQAFVSTYKPALGNTYNNIWIFEVGWLDVLIGYVKNGDTVGTVYGDDFILAGVHGSSPASGFKIYPDPCTDQLHITGITPGHSCNMIIKDIAGRDILSLTGGSVIDVSSLKPGIYILFLSDDSGYNSWRTRFIKK